MNQLGRFRETLATYRRYGWRLARVLMRADTLAELLREAGEAGGPGPAEFEGVEVREAPFDALWFARAAQGGREAWELRLVAEPPYALFEMFEPDEAEEEREDVRREMQARVRERATGGGAEFAG